MSLCCCWYGCNDSGAFPVGTWTTAVTVQNYQDRATYPDNCQGPDGFVSAVWHIRSESTFSVDAELGSIAGPIIAHGKGDYQWLPEQSQLVLDYESSDLAATGRAFTSADPQVMDLIEISPDAFAIEFFPSPGVRCVDYWVRQ